MITVTINDVSTTFDGKLVTDRNGKEERESGLLNVVSTRSSRYETYDRVDITTPHGTEQFLVQGDSVVQLNATEYRHELVLFENIAKFDTIYPADRSFRVLNQTLEDILNVYKRELLSFHNITITWDLSTTALNTVIPFKEFSGLNMSQILQSLFRSIIAVPKVTYSSGEWEIYAQYHNEKNNLITDTPITNAFQLNNIDYATRVKSQLKNAVNENAVTWFPSETGYVLPRSSTLEKVTSKLRYELDSPIIAILEAQVVGVDYQLWNTDTNSFDTFTNQTIDIASQIVQQDLYDTLPIPSAIQVGGLPFTDTNYPLAIGNTNNAKNNIQFQVGERYITTLFESTNDGLIFNVDTTYLINAIVKKVFDIAKDVGYQTLPTFYSGLTNLLLNIDKDDTDSIKMRFKYIRQRDMDIVHSRKTQGSMNVSTTMHQQRDSSVEAGQYLRNLKNYANRMGNVKYSRSEMFENGATPYSVFDYTDNKSVVTRVRNTYHSNDRVYCEYEVSENFANIEAEYALRRSSDPYTITGKSVTTNLINEEFVEFSESQRSESSILINAGKELILGLFSNTTVNENPIRTGVFVPNLTTWNDEYAIRMPVEATGNGNALNFHVYFDHPNIAGKTYFDIDDEVFTDYLNPLPYTDSNGRLEDFGLFFTEDVIYTDSGEYPLITNIDLYKTGNLTNEFSTFPLDLDSNAAFAFTLAFSFVSDDNIGIGEKLAKDNYLIQSLQSESDIDIYTSTKPYGQFDQVPRSYDTDNTANITYTYSFTNRKIDITPTIDVEHIAIVKDGEILLWTNKSISAGTTHTIYINFISELVNVAIDIYMNRLLQATATTSMTYQVNPFYGFTITAVGDTDIAYIQAFNQEYVIPRQEALASIEIDYNIALNQEYSLDAQQANSDINIEYTVALNQEFSINQQQAIADTNINYVIQLNQEMPASSHTATATTSITFLAS